MKVLGTILLAGSGLLACQKKDVATPATTIGQPFSVAYQQTTTLSTSSASTLGVTLMEVTDSRCPDGAQCIWAGEARVALLLTETTTSQTVHLGLRLNKSYANYIPDSLAITLNKQAYWLRLLDVTPYPAIKGSSGPKTATLRLRPQ